MRRRLYNWYIANEKRIEVALFVGAIVAPLLGALLAWLGYGGGIEWRECGSGRYRWSC